MTVPASDRIWHPGAAVQALANGNLPDSLVPGTFLSIQRKDLSDIQVATNPKGLVFANGGATIKSLRLAVNNQDTGVAGAVDNARAAVLSPRDLFTYGSHAFFGLSFYCDSNWDRVGACATWYGDPANNSGPMTIYGKPHPTSNATKGVIRMTRGIRYSGTDLAVPSRLKNPWTVDLLKGHHYSFVFDVQFSTKWDLNDPYNPYGGSFKVWVSVDGGAYVVSPNVIGTDRFDTQTFNESTTRGFYFKGAQIYTALAELSAADTIVHFLPPAIGKTLDAADPLELAEGGGGGGGGGTPMGQLSDAFSTAGTPDTTKWDATAQVGDVSVDSNGSLVLRPTPAEPLARVRSFTEWTAEGERFFIGPILPAMFTGGTGLLETRLLIYRSISANDYLVLRVYKDAAEPAAGTIRLSRVTAGVGTEVANVAYAGEQYAGILVAADGLSGKLQTTNTPQTPASWTDRGSVATPGWDFNGAKMAIEIAAKITSGSPTGISGAQIGGANIATAPPPTASVALLAVPAIGLGDLIVEHVASADPAAVLTNLADLPLTDLTSPTGAGVADANHRAWMLGKVANPAVDTAAWSLRFDRAVGQWLSRPIALQGADVRAADRGIEDVKTVPSASGATHTSATHVTTSANEMVVVCVSEDGAAGTWPAAPAGWTQLYVHKAGTVAIAGYQKLVAASGTSVSLSLTLTSGTAPAVLQSFVVRRGVADAGGSGGGAVDSVNGETGVVVLDAADVGAAAAAHTHPVSDLTQSGATADQRLMWTAAGGGAWVPRSPDYFRAKDVDALLVTFPPHGISGNGPLGTTLVPYLHKVFVPETMTLANLHVFVAAVGSTLAAGSNECGVFLFVSATSALLIGRTATQATAWTTSGRKDMGLTVIGGQSLTVPAGSSVWLAYLASGGTRPGVSRGNSGATTSDFNGLVTAAEGYRFGQLAAVASGSGLPTSFNPTTDLSPSSNAPVFMVAS